MKTRIKEEKVNLRKSVKLTENVRAAELRAKNKALNEGIDFTSAGKVIEVDLNEHEDHGKHVRFADQEPSKNYIVRPVDSNTKMGRKPGIEEAIREEMDRRRQSSELRRIAKIRGASALKRSQMTRQKITDSFFEDPEEESVVFHQKDPSLQRNQRCVNLEKKSSLEKLSTFYCICTSFLDFGTIRQ